MRKPGCCLQISLRTLREFWKDHFNIFNCVNIISKAWNGVTSRTLNSAWKKLWPESYLEKDFEGFEPEPVPIVESIVSLGKSMGLEVDGDDVEELLDAHNQELTTEELQHLQQQQTVAEEHAMGEEDAGASSSISSSEIKEICAKWIEVESFVEKHHPDKSVASRVMNLFNDNVINHFRQVLKRRQRQTSLDRFLIRKGSVSVGEKTREKS